MKNLHHFWFSAPFVKDTQKSFMRQILISFRSNINLWTLLFFKTLKTTSCPDRRTPYFRELVNIIIHLRFDEYPLLIPFLDREWNCPWIHQFFYLGQNYIEVACNLDYYQNQTLSKSTIASVRSNRMRAWHHLIFLWNKSSFQDVQIFDVASSFDIQKIDN